MKTKTIVLLASVIAYMLSASVMASTITATLKHTSTDTILTFMLGNNVRAGDIITVSDTYKRFVWDNSDGVKKWSKIWDGQSRQVVIHIPPNQAHSIIASVTFATVTNRTYCEVPGSSVKEVFSGRESTGISKPGSEWYTANDGCTDPVLHGTGLLFNPVSQMVTAHFPQRFAYEPSPGRFDWLEVRTVKCAYVPEGRGTIACATRMVKKSSTSPISIPVTRFGTVCAIQSIAYTIDQGRQIQTKTDTLRLHGLCGSSME